MPTLELPHNEVGPTGQEPVVAPQATAEADPARQVDLREPSHLAQFGDRLLHLVDRVAIFSLMPAEASGYPSDHRRVHEEPHVISANWHKG